MAALCLCGGAVALAQDDAPKAPGPLGDIVNTRAEGNDEAAGMQRKVDTISDDTDALLAEPTWRRGNRKRGSGTRILIDQLLGERRPAGYPYEPRSHYAVAASVSL